MTDKAIILDYAQEMQTNDEPWREFEYMGPGGCWVTCVAACNPLYTYHNKVFQFRRKPKTITVTMPVPIRSIVIGVCDSIHLEFNNTSQRDTALKAIHDAMGGRE